ncbi:hypothetical protein EDD11_002289 [Mortierella claussenii]|nr:hypothetical protein EDD11_002289 [Mortierella claussenii]
MWLHELKNTAEFTANQAMYEKAALEQQQQQAIHRATSLSATAAAASASAAAASKAALAEAAIRAANADAQVGSKGHLSLNELLDYINSQPGQSSGGKSKKGGKVNASKRTNKK